MSVMSTQMLLYQKNMQQSICPYSIPQSVLSSKTWKKRRFGLFSVQFSRPLIWCFESKFQDSKFNNIAHPTALKNPSLEKRVMEPLCGSPLLNKNAAISLGWKKRVWPLGGPLPRPRQDVVFRETGTDTVPNASPTAASASSDIYGAPTWELLGVH